MNKIFQKNRIPIILAVILHVVLFLAFFVKFSNESFQLQAASNAKKAQPIQAKSVTESQLNAEIQAIKKQRYEKKLAEIRHQKKLREKALAIKKARIEKAKRITRLKALEKQKRLKLAREKAEKIKRLKQKKMLLAKQKKLQEQLMHQQLQHEQESLNKVKTQIAQGVVDRYKAQILSAIQSNWRIQKVDAKLKCVYEIDVAPGGMILSTKLVKTSGDQATDASAKVAILKSSPLPVPNDPALFDQFRQLMLTLSPQGYVG